MAALALRELQARLWEAIALSPGRVRAAPELLEIIHPSEHLAAADRLAIYAEMYWQRILDVLREDFSRTAEALGDSGFESVVREYVRQRPSRDPSIARIGEMLAEFLATHLPGDAPPFAADLARLERARIEAFDAADAKPLRLDDLRDLPADDWPHLRLAPVPSLSVHTFGWPVQRLLDSSWQGELEEEPTTVRVWRSGYRVFHASVDAIELVALHRLRGRPTFAEISEACAEPEVAAALFARWLEDGIVVRGVA